MNLLRGRVHRLENLIDGLLKYSRVGRIQSPPEVVNIDRLLAEVIDLLSPPPGFTLIVEGEMPTLLTEKTPLVQVFTNAIDNAIRHHDRDDGNIKISVIDRGNCHEFSVTDDGPGIAPEYQEKVFAIFQTLEARDKKENTGIGLALIKKIIETHNGKIQLESQGDRGTSLRFTWLK
jgi:signal transduction histidine kinase